MTAAVGVSYTQCQSGAAGVEWILARGEDLGGSSPLALWYPQQDSNLQPYA